MVGDVFDTVHVDLGAVEAGYAEFGATEDIVQEPASERRFADTWSAIEENGHGGAMVGA